MEIQEKVEPRQTRITARLNGQGAMIEELMSVIEVVKPESARQDVRQAVLENNILQRPSLDSRMEVFKKLSVRYFISNAPNAVAKLVRAIQATPDETQKRLLAYVMLLWNDALVLLLGSEWLAQRLASLPYFAETRDIEIELERLSKQTPEIKTWKQGTRRNVATHYLSLVRDCGYATGSVRKQLRHPFIPPEVVLFGTQLIIGGGESVSSIPEHFLFKAMGLSVNDVISNLTELRQQGRIDFAIQGGTAHFAFRGSASSL